MTAAYIIAEYNPFHKGHEYHIKTTRDALRPDAVVCIMSGHFTQRGSAAISDKWSRARMALRGGADLVFELHPVYACSSAEYFARGALMSVAALGAGGWLSFGAENTDLSLISNVADILNDEPAIHKAELADKLDKGYSYAAARQRALSRSYPAAYKISPGNIHTVKNELAALMKAPNNILAIEYVRAVKSLGLPLTPFAVRRGGYPGAACIRDGFRARYQTVNESFHRLAQSAAANGRFNDKYDECIAEPIHIGALPDYSHAILGAEFSLGRGPVFDESFYPIITAIIRRGAPEDMLGYNDVGEGLENRLYRAALAAPDYTGLIRLAAARRYPMSRVRRIYTRILLGYTKTALTAVNAEEGPPYLRVLGFNETGRKFLSGLKTGVPVITSYKRLKTAGARARDFMGLEARATDIYATAFQNPEFHAAGQDFTRNPARL